MKRSLLIGLVIVACLVVGHAAMADPSREECLFGWNSGGSFIFFPDWFTGQEGYKYLIYPPDYCDCTTGFELTTISMSIHFLEDTYPFSFSAYVDIEEAVWDDETSCWVPGPELCASPVSTITIPSSGYDFAELSIGDDCECLAMDDMYFLSFHFLDPIEGELILGGVFPDQCTVYNDKGAGWVDLYSTIGTDGDLMMNGNANCCVTPVGHQTWGGLKSRYR